MPKIGPSSGDAQEALPPSDFEQALEKQSHPSTLPTGRVEGKGGPQQPLHGGDRARQTLDKEYVQSKKDGYATNLWTAQVQGTRGQFCISVYCPRASTDLCCVCKPPHFERGLRVRVRVRARARACV